MNTLGKICLALLVLLMCGFVALPPRHDILDSDSPLTTPTPNIALLLTMWAEEHYPTPTVVSPLATPDLPSVECGIDLITSDGDACTLV